MIIKEYWDQAKLNGIFWLGDNVSILAHKAGFVRLEKTKEYYGKDLEEASKILGISIEDLRNIRRKVTHEDKC